MNKTVKLIDITGKAISGEWGSEDKTGDGIKVLRTTNFTNDGTINYDSVVLRDITKDISEKYLTNGDIIIEKSGGSDKQPVGRVVYFEGKEHTFLFNNFTGLLRIKDNSKCYSKYLFYVLFSNYKKGGTKQYQNKTTGLHNLQTDVFVKEFAFPLPPLDEQKHIAAVLDKVTDLIAMHKRQLELLDELVKARFVEMFGDVIQNNRNWEKSIFSDIATSRLGKMLDSSKNTGENSFPYLANFNVQWFRFDVEKLNQMDFNEIEQAEFELLDGDLLVCEGGEIGRCAVWHNQVKNCFFQKAIHRVRCDFQKILPEYLMYWFKYNCDHKGFSAIEGAKATISHLPSIKLKALIVTVPPLKLQQQFADFVEQTNKSEFQIAKSLEQLETLKKALMQKYFG